MNLIESVKKRFYLKRLEHRLNKETKEEMLIIPLSFKEKLDNFIAIVGLVAGLIGLGLIIFR